MSALVWAVKRSLLDYVRTMDDGEVVVDGAQSTPDGFVFPSANTGEQAGEHRFSGTVTLLGHGGMMRVVIADPAVVRQGAEWVLTIADPDDPSARVEFARMAGWSADETGSLRAHGTVLTESGSDLFFGPYRDGTPLDDPSTIPG